MEKRLKDYIKANQEAFDDRNPPEHLWTYVLERLDNEQLPIKSIRRAKWQRGVRNMLKVAAIVTITGTLGIGLYFYGKHQGYDDYARINPELAATKINVQTLVSQRKDSIASYVSNNPALQTEFLQTMTFMEANYDSLKNELPLSPNRERILEAMIVNLKTQAEVLNQQLFILNQVTSNKHEKL